MSALSVTHKYDDIINLSWPDIKKRTKISPEDRGIQFAPFAALTGYEDVIDETARLTDADTDLTDSSILALDAILQQLEQRIRQMPSVRLIYFRMDPKKSGGSFVEVTSRAKKLDRYSKSLILENNQEIPFGNMKEIEILD